MRTQPVPLQTIQLNAIDARFPLDLKRDKYMLGLNMTFRGRMVITVAGTQVNPEGILNLVRRVQINFTHEIYGSDTPLDLAGPTLFTYQEIYNSAPPRLNTSAPLTNQISTVDFEFIIPYQFPPENIFGRDQLAYLHDATRDSFLQLVITWGDPTDVVPGCTATLSAFGSGSGNPTCDVELIQVLDQETNPFTALVRRASKEVDLSGVPFPVTNDKVTDLPIGETIRSLLLKQYVRSTTAGVPTSEAASLVDPINPGVDAGLTMVGVRVGLNYIRRNLSWNNSKQVAVNQFRLHPFPLGYDILEWVDRGNIDRALFTQDFTTRRLSLDLAGTVITQSNGRLEITTTSIKPNPQIKRAKVATGTTAQ